MNIRLLVLFFCLQISAFAQNALHVVVEDSTTHEKLVGATVAFTQSRLGGTTDLNGLAVIQNIPDGNQTFVVAYAGYQKKEITRTFPLANANEIMTIALVAVEHQTEEIIISSTRTNARIDDLPVKVEVLGQDDMDEESVIVPGGIGSILGDLSVITIQKTNPINGNDAVRMQGLDTRYTQLLRDGLPLYEGFSGSLGVLAIPPLDLKQVEIIKGSASTLYGGGAIGGLINFISKTPTDSSNVTLTFNQTSLLENNFNAFISKRTNRVGATLFAGANLRQDRDLNSDGFSEVPRQKSFSVHPRLFFYLSPRANADLGLTIMSDNRRGGDTYAIRAVADSTHPYLLQEQIQRSTVDGHFSFDFTKKASLNIKSTASIFDRSLYLAGFNFAAKQYSSYTEANYLYKNEKHTLVTGINLTTEDFQKQRSDFTYFSNYAYQTLGAFAQDDWQIWKKLMVEAGLRVDKHSRYNYFVLPALGLYYRPTADLSVRLHYGSGYKTPSLFAQAQPEYYATLLPVSRTIKPESSTGLNMDINYRFAIGDAIGVQINQAFYYTNIQQANTIARDSSGRYLLVNANYDVHSIGTDTYIRMSLDDWELYLGYNHTEAQQIGTSENVNLSFNPKDKFATTLAYEIEGKWRMGVEAAWNANQYIDTNFRVPNYWFFAAMVERKFAFGSLVLNCENLGDYRQSRFAPLVTGTTQAPVFAPVWASLEGRVINLSLKIAI